MGVLLTFEGSRFRLLAARHPKSKQLKLFQFSPVRNYTSSWPRAPRAAAPRALGSASLAPSLRAPLLAPVLLALARGARGCPGSALCTAAATAAPNFPSLRPPPPTSKKKGGGRKKEKRKKKKSLKKILCRTTLEKPSDKLKRKKSVTISTSIKIHILHSKRKKKTNKKKSIFFFF